MTKKEKMELCRIAASWTYNGDGNPLTHAGVLLEFMNLTEDDNVMDTQLMLRAMELVLGEEAQEIEEDAFIDVWVEEGREAVEARMTDVPAFVKYIQELAEKERIR